MLVNGADFQFFDDDSSDSAGEHFPGSRRPYENRSLKHQKQHGTTSRGHLSASANFTPQTSHSDQKIPAVFSGEKIGKFSPLETPTWQYKGHECVNQRILVRRQGTGTDGPVAKKRQSAHMSVRDISPKGAKPTKKSKVFRFMRRPLRKQKKEKSPEPEAVPEQQMSLPAPSPENLPTRPTTAAPSTKVLSRATSRTSRKSKFVEAADQLSEIPEANANTAYVPKHAASDFSAMKVQAPLTSTPSSLHSGDVPPEPLEESNDYQIFLAQARAAAASTYNDRGIISPNPQRPQAQTSNQNQVSLSHSSDLKRAKSTPQRQRSQRVRPLEKVGEYVRPSALKKTTEGKDAPGLGFSLVGDTIRRSLSTSQRNEGGRPRGVSDGNAREKRRMPVAGKLNGVGRDKGGVWLGY